MSVFRLSVNDADVTVEAWRAWAELDAAPPPARGLWRDIAYAMQALRSDVPRSGGVVELQRLRVQNGHLGDVAGLLRQDAGAWTDAGSTVIGTFKVVHGDDLPACLLLLHWPSLTAALDAQPLVERHAVWTAARRASREANALAVVRASRRIFRASLVLTSGSAA